MKKSDLADVIKAYDLRKGGWRKLFFDSGEMTRLRQILEVNLKSVRLEDEIPESVHNLITSIIANSPRGSSLTSELLHRLRSLPTPELSRSTTSSPINLSHSTPNIMPPSTDDDLPKVGSFSPGSITSDPIFNALLKRTLAHQIPQYRNEICLDNKCEVPEAVQQLLVGSPEIDPVSYRLEVFTRYKNGKCISEPTIEIWPTPSRNVKKKHSEQGHYYGYKMISGKAWHPLQSISQGEEITALTSPNAQVQLGYSLDTSLHYVRVLDENNDDDSPRDTAVLVEFNLHLSQHLAVEFSYDNPRLNEVIPRLMQHFEPSPPSNKPNFNACKAFKVEEIIIALFYYFNGFNPLSMSITLPLKNNLNRLAETLMSRKQGTALQRSMLFLYYAQELGIPACMPWNSFTTWVEFYLDQHWFSFNLTKDQDEAEEHLPEIIPLPELPATIPAEQAMRLLSAKKAASATYSSTSTIIVPRNDTTPIFVMESDDANEDTDNEWTLKG